MSQLVRAVMTKDTGERRLLTKNFSPLFQDVFNMKYTISDYNADQVLGKLYRISVTVGSQVIVSEMDDDLLEHAIERTKTHIVEGIFGEFREDFYRLEKAIYDRDFQKARSLLTEFQRKMYEV